MTKVLRFSAITLAVAALCVPAAAQYAVNWGTGFEAPTYLLGPLVPQDGWTAAGTTSPNVVWCGSSAQAVQQAVGASFAAKDLTYWCGGYVYKSGWAKFWLYDPGDIPDGAGGHLQTDGRVGIGSSAGAGSVAYMWTAGVQTNRSHDYWVFQWSWSPIVGDGASAPSGQGYTFTPGLPAPRVWNTWNYVIISWVFTYNEPNNPESGGSAQVQWRVNQTGMTPNLTLDFDDTSGRWTYSHDVAGVVLGSTYGCDTVSAFDDFELHGGAVPEPSSLLALGAGLTGLAGLIRRRR